MKKTFLVLSLVAFLFLTPNVLAATPIPIHVSAPGLGIDPNTSIGGLISNALKIAYIVGALLVLFFIVIGAIQWITSGGDKEKVGGARKMITNAIIGLVILALAFFLVNVVGNILNIDLTDLPGLPSLGPPAPSTP